MKKLCGIILFAICIGTPATYAAPKKAETNLNGVACGDSTKIKSKKALRQKRNQVAKTKEYSRYYDIYELIRSEFITLKVDGTNVYNVKMSSMNLTMQVLYVVDDVVVGDISYIPPTDIERIEFFDDYRATTYGMRGANGVLKIKMKTR